jgi:hypothetical protein
MSSPEIDIIQRPFDRKHTKEWIPDNDKGYIFFQMYIQEKYKNIVYYTPLLRIEQFLENLMKPYEIIYNFIRF